MAFWWIRVSHRSYQIEQGLRTHCTAFQHSSLYRVSTQCHSHESKEAYSTKTFWRSSMITEIRLASSLCQDLGVSHTLGGTDLESCAGCQHGIP